METYKTQYFTQKILEWASLNLRDYPWRKERTVYRIFIAEFFLQRTKADQVKEVYRKFIEKYPSFQQLRQANIEELKVFFSMLGLIKRADFLWKAIQSIEILQKSVENLTNDEFFQITGIGNYTLNAIRCFGKNERCALVDSNIVRIFTRFFNFHTKINPARNDPRIWTFAEELLPETEYVSYNYAIIDFGALICTPKNSLCSECPLQKECYFHNGS